MFAKHFLTAFVLLTPLSLPCLAQKKPGGGMEEFEAVDPYTKGKEELVKKLGYVNLGEFAWYKSHRTGDVKDFLGGTEFLWVETEHFKIGSSLGTYRIPADKEEKDLIKKDLARLKKRIGRVKFPRHELDPWLRLHLYAQRAEDLYAKFMDDFALKQEDFPESAPYLGMPQKQLILLCQRNGELVRYTETIYNQKYERVFRTGTWKECMFFGASMEGIRESWSNPEDQPFESMLYCQMAASLAQNFVDGFHGKLYEAPRWLGNVLGHVYVRQINPRWVTGYGYTGADTRTEDSWKWRPDVLKMVKNEYFTTARKMFTWAKYEDMNKRDHMIAWSKLDYLLYEVDGKHKDFLTAMVVKGKGEDEAAELSTRQVEALEKGFGWNPEEFDEAWAAYVKKNYKRR